jgi:hypothetical protein
MAVIASLNSFHKTNILNLDRQAEPLFGPMVDDSGFLQRVFSYCKLIPCHCIKIKKIHLLSQSPLPWALWSYYARRQPLPGRKQAGIPIFNFVLFAPSSRSSW